MKPVFRTSIKQRIYWSFALLVFVFVVNGVITLVVLSKNKKEYGHISRVTDPSVEALHDLRKVMRESLMFTTNWIFIRSDEGGKKALVDLQTSAYPALKKQLVGLTAHWYQRATVDSLREVFTGFESVVNEEKYIMNLLQHFHDYNDPIKKFEAEERLESKVIPAIARLTSSLNEIMQREKANKAIEANKLEAASVFLRTLILVLAVSTFCLGIFFSIYMAKNIVQPILKIGKIISDLGKGKIGNLDHKGITDEVGKMIHSVNSLSQKLHATATFAQETGLRNFEMPFVPLSDDDILGKSLLAMRENLKAGETNLAVKNRELERKNKELEQFAFVASHDLQEPLRTTSSFVGLLQQQYQGKLDSKADKYLTYITQASDRMQTLITDLLEYSRIGSEKELRQVDCNKVLSGVLSDIKLAIDETQAEITAGDLPIIAGYETEIKQLFHNLTTNSIKFRQPEVKPQIAIAAWKNKDCWQFAFSDNGIGIANEHFDRIFIIFQRLHNRTQYEGSGIGLSHCKKIVELHKGKIWLESEPGKGTTFYFTIPQHAN